MKRFGVVLLAVAIAVLAAMFFNVGTWELYQDQKAKKSASDARMRMAEEERARMLEEKSELEKPRGREALAREQGYKRPGEQPLPVEN